MSSRLATDDEIVAVPDGSVLPTEASSLPLTLSRSRLWFWGSRSLLSLVDQGLVSGSGFLLNVGLARWLTKEQYGVFAVCFASFLFISGFHNVLVIEPLTVMGSSRYSDRLTDYFSGQLQIHMLISGALTIIALVAVAGLAFLKNALLLPAICAFGIGLPFILLLFAVRRMCYVLQSPSLAVRASGLYCLTLVSTMALLSRVGRVTPATAFLAIAFASLLPSVFLLRRLSIPVQVIFRGGSLPLRSLLHENWNYAHWLVLTAMLSWVSVQMQTFLTAGLLELSAAGALRAMQLPSLLMSQLIAATLLLLLPSMSQELGRGDLSRLHKKVMLVATALSLFGIIFVAALYVTAVPLERLLFGGKYASVAWLIPVLGLAPLFTGLASGLSLALRTLRKAKFELLAYTISAVVATSLALFLAPRWGLTGVAVSIVGGAAALASGVVFCYVRYGRGSANPHDYRSPV